MISHAFGQHTRSNDVGRDIPSPPLDSTHDRTTSGVACQHRLKASHTDERCRAWHDITAFVQHTRSNDVGCDKPSLPSDNTHGRTTSGMTCHHCLWTAHTIERRWAWHAIITFGQHKRSDGVGRGIPLSPLDGKHDRTTSGVTCHHRLWTAHTVEHRLVWHAIIAFGQLTRSNDVGRGMTSPLWDNTHDRITSGVK